MFPIELEEYWAIRQADDDIGDNAAAMLVLAAAVNRSKTFDKQGAENFGHEVALALKEALGSTRFEVDVSVGDPVQTQAV